MTSGSSWTLTFVLLFVLTLAWGCGPRERSEPAERSPSPLRGLEEPPEEALASINLQNATVAEVARALSISTGRPLVIDPGAAPLAESTRISVLSPSPSDPERFVRLVREAIRPQGFSLEETEDGLILRGPAPERPASRRWSPIEDDRRIKIAAGVSVISTTERQITREARDLLFPEKSEAFSPGTIRVISSSSGGEEAGYKLFGLRRSSIAGCLGLRNGDLITSVQGISLAREGQLRKAYEAIGGAEEIVVELTRRGEPMKLRYSVLDKLTAPVTCASRLEEAAEAEEERAAERSAEQERIAAGVRRLSDREFLVTHEAAALLRGEGGGVGQHLMTQARILPYSYKGATRGFKLYGVRQETTFATLGFKTGDIVTTINGVTLTGPDSLAKIPSLLKGKTSTKVEIIRRGEPVTLRYKLVKRLP